MFVVATVERKPAGTPGEHEPHWPVVFEHDQNPVSTFPIAYRDSRELADKLAAALNKALTSA